MPKGSNSYYLSLYCVINSQISDYEVAKAAVAATAPVP